MSFLPLVWRSLSALFVLLLAACGQKTELPPPTKSGELVVLMRNSPTTYFHNANGEPAGFEYDLARRFAKSQGWTLRVQEAGTLEDLFAALEAGEAHLAAAGLTVTEDRLARVRFGPVYAKERELVVCGVRIHTPRSLAQLPMLRLEVVAGSSHLEHLKGLKQAYPNLNWIEVQAPSTEALLERVATGLSDCAVADATSFEVVWNYLPSIVAAFDLGEQRELAWALPQHADPALLKAMATFFARAESDGTLRRLRERYFGHVQRLDEADVVGLLERRQTLLPELRAHFYAAQLETELDWRFLAALAYQESQWNPRAVSKTGVRGIMMLTETTADRLGVDNRLDPRQSILGGARYVLMLKSQLAESVQDPDRTWMALAAYNIGMGHLEDARRLARHLGRNPDRWADVKAVLPLLSRSEHASVLRYGFARGGEARALTENIRIYYDILSRYEKPYTYRIGFDD